jgi:protein-tyrosine-phosphatase
LSFDLRQRRSRDRAEHTANRVLRNHGTGNGAEARCAGPRRDEVASQMQDVLTGAAFDNESLVPGMARALELKSADLISAMHQLSLRSTPPAKIICG